MSKNLRTVWVKHDLKQTFAVSQIDENHTAMVAAALRPAGNRDNLSGQARIDLTAVVSTHSRLGCIDSGLRILRPAWAFWQFASKHPPIATRRKRRDIPVP